MTSIKKTTILIFLAAFFGLTAALTGVFHYELTRNTIPLNRSITQKFVNNRTSQINSWFGERLAELRLLATLPNTRTYDRQHFFAETENLVQTEPDNYLSIRLVSKNGTSYSADPIIPGFSVRNRPYYQEMAANPQLTYTVSDQLISKEDHHEAVVILYRLKQPLTDDITYLAAAIPLEKVMSLAKDLNLYDGTGILLGSGTPQPVIDHKRQLLLTPDIDYLPDWQVNYIVNKKSLGGSTETLLHVVQLVLVVLLVLLGLSLLLLFKKILQPILALDATMQQVQAGNKTVRADTHGPAEIAQLAIAFNQTLDKVYENESKYRAATLRVLQEQIQPHFLYNTLNTIQWQVLGGDTDSAVTMLENLSTFFRKGLNQGGELSTVADEIAHVRSYLAIQQVRHEALSEVAITLPSALAKEWLLHFLLQPLVENAIDHGIRTMTVRPSRLWITVSQTDTGLALVVGNNGTPIPLQQLRRLNQADLQDEKTGFGLYNIRRRLQLIYGDRASLTITSSETATEFCIQVPFISDEEAHIYDKPANS